MCKLTTIKKIILFGAISAILVISTIQCRKEVPLNIVLYNQPLKTIQHYIQGKWKLIYGKGGICGTCITYCNNCYVEFAPNNIFKSRAFVFTTDTTTIHWVRDIGTYTNGDSTYLMTFKDKQGVPWIYVIEQIYHDTLIFHDNSSDAVFYHCVKLK